MSTPPVALVLSGLGPSGGAGIGADIQTLTVLGVHAAPLVSVLTVQDSHNVSASSTVDAALVLAQGCAVIGDYKVDVIKLGALGCSDMVKVAVELIRLLPGIPMVLDPVVFAGGGGAIGSEDPSGLIRTDLLPLASLVVPNLLELRVLSARPDESIGVQIGALFDRGVEHVLLTGGHGEPGKPVSNRLYSSQGLVGEWHWERLPGEFHGSGCTLAAACAGYLAKGCEMPEAVERAQRFTWNTLAAATPLGGGQNIPFRFPKSNE